MTDLYDLLPTGSRWTLTSAFAINDADQIRGVGMFGGVSRAVRLTPALPGDANLDGKVDINDLTIVLAHYGESAASAGGLSAVPEPASLLMLGALFLALAGIAIRCARGPQP